MIDLTKYNNIVRNTHTFREIGHVTEIIGLIIEADGPSASIGDLCYIYPKMDQEPIWTEVVGFKSNKVLLMPLGDMEGLRPGATVVNSGGQIQVKVGSELLGRVLDGLGRPIDELSPLRTSKTYSTKIKKINPLTRKRIKEPLIMGVRSIDAFTTIGKGQRLGIFAGSGVGKSTALGMIARNTNADMNVIALIGERGREVREFIENSLGPEGLSKSVVVVATSDQPSLVKIKAAHVATSIAEYFRDGGRDVLFMLDSLTRIAMAQREVGLAVGEPPATRGYTPSVFALMPKLLERTGTTDTGTITGLYTVLVEGDDFNEPVSDTVRGILDGHILLSRELAHRNHYPAVDVLGSISRVMPEVSAKEHIEAAGKIRDLLATYNKNADLINIGAYVTGTDPKIDRAIRLNDEINNFLQQPTDEKADYPETVNRLIEISQK
ncbi:MAG: flagellar protein export ATPase FliI [Candidatus Melainabacteria bacterium RIFOXYA12_FULL_32_12]|nr:MAG: flagellar protein export ATPase FliI [Candidatus Melainabacteria bacterium RIFOXYA2_FULL_32_9]OGI24626.1 MAG: flagellar protein export ATPase FliI [Candidatus Melainabacteria bacterium RIFOXYA12_FULL_32_12]